MKKFLLNVLIIVFLLSVISMTVSASQNFGETLSSIVTVPETAIKNVGTKENFISRISQLPSENKVIMPFEVQGETKIYVSPTGQDSNDGSIEKPLRTLKKALEKVTGLDYNAKKSGVVIYLRGGEYLIEETVKINGKHSGMDDAPLYIAAYPGETPVFSTSASFDLSGADEVTDGVLLKRIPESAKGKVKVIDLKKNGINNFPEPYYMNEVGTPYEGMTKNDAALFLGSERLTQARYPNVGYLYIQEFLDASPVLMGVEKNGVNDGEGIEFTLEDDEVFDWFNTEKIVVKGSTRYNYDLVDLRVKNMDEEKMSIRTYGMPDTGCQVGHGAAIYFTNALEALDTEGEWYADIDAGKLYVYPYDALKDETLYLSYESHDMIAMNDCENIVFDGLKFTNAASIAIDGDYCENIVVQRCDFSNLTQSVCMRKAKNSGVTTCSFYANTNTPVTLNVNSAAESNSGDAVNDMVPKNLFVQNSYFCMGDTLEEKYTSSMLGVGCIISHNFFQNGYNSAITPAVPLGYVEYNEMVGFGKTQNDGGSLYSGSQWTNFGQIVRYNYSHHPSANPHNSKGLYFDDGTSFFTAYGNIVHNTSQAIFSHNGKGGVVFNNILLDSGQAFATSDNYLSSTRWRAGWNTTGTGWYRGLINYHYRPEEIQWQRLLPEYYDVKTYLDNTLDQFHSGEMSDDNLVMTEDERWLRTPTDFYVANNIYNSGEIVITKGAEPTAELENNYKVDNSVFADYDNYDFTIVDEDLLKKIPGFVQIPVDKIGLIEGTPKWENMEIGEITPVFPKTGYENRVSNSDIFFDWLQVEYASQYQLIIAKDKDFKEIVFDKHFDHSTAVVSLEEPGLKYYYKIIAKSFAKQMDYAERESAVFEFDTMTYDEANLVSKADKSVIKAALNKLKKIRNGVVEGGNAGQYPEGTLMQITNYIAEIEEFIETVNIQRDINLKIPEIDAFARNIQKTINPGIVIKPSLDAADWYPLANASVELAPGSYTVANNEDGILSLANKDNDSLWFKSDTEIPYNSFASFKYKIDSVAPYLVFGLQFEKDGINLWDADSYYLVIKEDVIELQKYLFEGAHGIVKTVENKDIFNSNQWHNVVMGTISTENGTRFVVIIDKKVVFDYEDEVDPIHMESKFSQRLNTKQLNVEVDSYEISYEDIMNIINNNQEQ